MIDHRIFNTNRELIHRIIEYFTAESVNTELFQEIKEIGLRQARNMKRHNSEQFVNMGYFSINDFLMYSSEKKLVGNGIPLNIVELIAKVLAEKNILIPASEMIVGKTEKRYKANGLYAALQFHRDLILNLVFGFRFIVEKYRQSIFKIEHINKNDDPEIGTGFLIEHNGEQLIVTNRHVLEQAKKINIYDVDDHKIETGEPFLDVSVDLALVPLKKKLQYPILFLEAGVEILSEIVTIGYPSVPMTQAAYQVCHMGEVNSFVQDYSHNKLFLISAKTSSGNSGSPVLNQAGLVVGIVTKELFEEEQFQKKGKLPYYAAIPTEQIFKILTIYPRFDPDLND